MVLFLGSTIGNLDAVERRHFLSGVHNLLARDHAFLLGIDLVKDQKELVRAYDDAQGLQRNSTAISYGGYIASSAPTPISMLLNTSRFGTKPKVGSRCTYVQRVATAS